MLSQSSTIPDILSELNTLRAKLVYFWYYFVPEHPPEPEKNTSSHFSKTYFRIKNADQYHLTATQYKNLLITLSAMIQLTDELIDGHLPEPKMKRASDWKPLQFRENHVHYYLTLENKEWEKPQTSSPAYHLEFHKEEFGVEIKPGEPRTRSILNNTLTLFAKGLTAVTEHTDIALQTFCDYLEPADAEHSCINARIRMALDHALSKYVDLQTFSKLLEKAIRKSEVEFKDQNNFFNVLAYLMQDYWNTPFKGDTGTNGVFKTPGILNKSLIKEIYNTITDFTTYKPDTSLTTAYLHLPLKYQNEFWQMVVNDPSFIDIINKLAKDPLIWLLKEAGIPWDKTCFDAIIKRLEKNPEIICAFRASQLFIKHLQTDEYKSYLNVLHLFKPKEIRNIFQFHWRSYIALLQKKDLTSRNFQLIINSLNTYLPAIDILKLIEQAQLLPELLTQNNSNKEKLASLYPVFYRFAEQKEAKTPREIAIVEKLLCTPAPNVKLLFDYWALNNPSYNVKLLIQSLSPKAAEIILRKAKLYFNSIALQSLFDKIPDLILVKRLLKNTNQIWSENNVHQKTVENLKTIFKKLNAIDLIEIIESHQILQTVASSLADLEFFLNELNKYLTPEQIVKMIHRAKILPFAKEKQAGENKKKLVLIEKYLKLVSEYKDLDPALQFALDELLVTQYPNSNLLGVLALQNHDLSLKLLEKISIPFLIKAVRESHLIWTAKSIQTIIARLEKETAIALLSELLNFYESRFDAFAEVLNSISQQLGYTALNTILSCWEIKCFALFDTTEKMQSLRAALKNPLHYLQLIEEAKIIPKIISNPTLLNMQQLECVMTAIKQTSEMKDPHYESRDLLNRLFTTAVKSDDGLSFTFFGTLAEHINLLKFIDLMSPYAVATIILESGKRWQMDYFAAMLDKMATPALIKQTLKNSNQLWSNYLNSPDQEKDFSNKLKLITEKLKNPQDLLEIIESNGILKQVAHDLHDLKFVLNELAKYLSLDAILFLLHKSEMKFDHDKLINMLDLEFPENANFNTSPSCPAAFSFSNATHAKQIIRLIAGDEKLIRYQATADSYQIQMTEEACKVGYVEKILSLYPTRNPIALRARNSLQDYFSQALKSSHSALSFFSNKLQIMHCKDNWRTFSTHYFDLPKTSSSILKPN